MTSLEIQVAGGIINFLDIENDPIEYIKERIERNVTTGQSSDDDKEFIRQITEEESLAHLRFYLGSSEEIKTQLKLDKNKTRLRTIENELHEDYGKKICLTQLYFCYKAIDYILEEQPSKIKELNNMMQEMQDKILKGYKSQNKKSN